MKNSSLALELTEFTKLGEFIPIRFLKLEGLDEAAREFTFWGFVGALTVGVVGEEQKKHQKKSKLGSKSSEITHFFLAFSQVLEKSSKVLAQNSQIAKQNNF